MTLSEHIEYRREAFLGQSLTIRFQLTGVSADASRWRVFHEFLHEDGATAASLTVVGAWVDLKRRKITAPPDEVRALFDSVRSAECETLG